MNNLDKVKLQKKKIQEIIDRHRATETEMTIQPVQSDFVLNRHDMNSDYVNLGAKTIAVEKEVNDASHPPPADNEIAINESTLHNNLELEELKSVSRKLRVDKKSIANKENRGDIKQQHDGGHKEKFFFDPEENDHDILHHCFKGNWSYPQRANETDESIKREQKSKAKAKEKNNSPNAYPDRGWNRLGIETGSFLSQDDCHSSSIYKSTTNPHLTNDFFPSQTLADGTFKDTMTPQKNVVKGLAEPTRKKQRERLNKDNSLKESLPTEMDNETVTISPIIKGIQPEFNCPTGEIQSKTKQKNYDDPQRSPSSYPRIINVPTNNNDTRIIVLDDVDSQDPVGADGRQIFVNNLSSSRKLKQEGRNEIAESELFLPFILLSRASLEHMEFNNYLDKLSNFVDEHKVHFSNDADAEEYFKKCNRRRCWEFGPEWNRILKVLRGSNAPKMIRDKEVALQEFLIYRENETVDGRVILKLSETTDFRKFGDFLRERHPTDFECLRTFLMSHPLLTAYMRTIVSTPIGHFPYKGATQNLALWLHGETQCGKTTLAAIITNFLVVCKMQASNEKFMNSCGENKIPNKSFFFNIFQLEELKAKGGKGPEDLMDLLDSGVSIIKGSETSEWGSDNSRSAYHFPILITSNFRPSEFFSSRNPVDKLFYEAALRRIISIEITPGALPDLSSTNRFGVSRVALAKFVWAFVYHSEIEVDFMGRSLQQQENDITFYNERDAPQLTLQELALPVGMRISLLEKKQISIPPPPNERKPQLIDLFRHSSSSGELSKAIHSQTTINSRRVQEQGTNPPVWSTDQGKRELPNLKLDLMESLTSIQCRPNLENKDNGRNPIILFPKDLDTLSFDSSIKSMKDSKKGSVSRDRILLYLQEFLRNLARKILDNSFQTAEIKSNILLQRFTRWLEQNAFGQEPPNPYYFGKLMKLLSGIEIIRRADCLLYRIDSNHWSGPSI